MPTYEYRCRQCHEHLEVVQSFSDDPLTTHDVCGGALRKVFHARGVVFKGSGFYVTDSRKPNPANGKTSSASEDNKASKAKPEPKKSPASSESQPASAE